MSELEALISAVGHLDDATVVAVRETVFWCCPVFGGPDPDTAWEQWCRRYYRRLSMDPTEPTELRDYWARGVE